jgi:hypothetical protein
VPLALLLRASCPSQRSVPPSCRPGVAKQARLGRWISPGGSLRVAWVVRVSSQAAHNVTRSPPDQTHTHPSAGKRSSTKYTRSPSTLAAYSYFAGGIAEFLVKRLFLSRSQQLKFVGVRHGPPISSLWVSYPLPEISALVRKQPRSCERT